jgi:hypothetical protein
METVSPGVGPNLCHVCGWDFGEPPWVDGQPEYLVCLCCGAESGVDDISVGDAQDYLARWVKSGASWFVPAERPESWDLASQLARAGILPPPT